MTLRSRKTLSNQASASSGIVSRALTAICLTLVVGPSFAAGDAPPLVLERTIQLSDVAGRIDGTVDVVDLGSGKAIGRISGLGEPQGVAYVPASDLIVVADGASGSVRMFHASDLSPAGEIALGEDADNVRVDPHSGRVVVGYGSGALVRIDPVSMSKLADIKLPAHPEGFQLESTTERVFVNLPDVQQIGVADLGAFLV